MSSAKGETFSLNVKISIGINGYTQIALEDLDPNNTTKTKLAALGIL